MGAMRVLLIAAQQGAVPLSGEDDGIVYTVVGPEVLARLLRAGPSRGVDTFDAVAIDGAAEGASHLLERLIAADYPAPVVMLVPPGAAESARRFLRAGAAGCVVRRGEYREQLRLTIDAALAHREQLRQYRHASGGAGVASEAPRPRMPDHLWVALHHLAEGVLVVDARSGALVAANPAAERLFGTLLSDGESLGVRSAYRLLDRAGRPLAPHETPSRRVFSTGRARIGERLVIERPDGRQVAVVASTVPIHDAAGELREIVSVYQELTDQVHTQLVRDEILSIASHELRTPLTVVLGYSSLLRSLPAMQEDPRTQRALTKIYEQSLRMRELIEHLLDFSRIALGRLQLQWGEFDLAALVREVGRQQQVEARPRPVRLALSEGPLAMTGDYGRLAQALQQVIRATWQQHERREVLIAIHTGTTASFRRIGMALPPESERRYALIQVGRADASLPPAPGTALAGVDSLLAPEQALELTISAELVRLHGGALLVEPQPSDGNAFNLLLPLQDHAGG